MMVEDNCIKNLHANDEFIDARDGDYEFEEGNAVYGKTTIGKVSIENFSGIIVDDWSNIWIPEDGILRPFPIEPEEYEVFVNIISHYFMNWLRVFGEIKSICYRGIQEIQAVLDDKTTLYFENGENPSISFIFDGETITAGFHSSSFHHTEISPFKEAPAASIGVVFAMEDGELPAALAGPFGASEFYPPAQTIDVLEKYDGKNWPGTEVPVLFRPPGNATLRVNDVGVYYEKNGKIVSTVFITPVKPTRIVKKKDKAIFVYKDYTFEIDYTPTLDELITNLLTAEVLYKNRDIMSEFHILG